MSSDGGMAMDSPRKSVVGGRGDHFGCHLTLDGYGGAAERLNDHTLIQELLAVLPNLLGMYPLHQPAVLQVPPLSEKDGGGYSGFVIVAESHISLHTFPDRGFVSADVYTCRSTMDIQAVIDQFKVAFALGEVETNFILRGTRYHQQIPRNP